jgi:hypothetical protein
MPENATGVRCEVPGSRVISAEPPSVLGAWDFAVLTAFVNSAGESHGFAAGMLQRKLISARVVPIDELAPDVVTINSRVVFSVDGGPFETRTLVHWHREPDVGLTLPVTIPLSIAMLGHKAGDTVCYAQRDGSHWSVTILDVPYQPAAARRRRLSWLQPRSVAAPTSTTHRQGEFP